MPLVAFEFKLDRFGGVVRAVDCHVFLGFNFRPRNHPGFPFVVVVFRGREERTEAKEEEKGEQCAAAAAAASSSREEERCHRDKTNA